MEDKSLKPKKKWCRYIIPAALLIFFGLARENYINKKISGDYATIGMSLT